MESVVELVLLFAIVLAVWHLLSLVYNLYRAYQAIKIIDQKIIDAVERKLEDSIKVIEVNIEKHQDTFYLFSRENNQFIAQGKTKEEITEAIQQRFKGYRVMAQEEQLKELGLDW
jgi:hypothetical protein